MKDLPILIFRYSYINEYTLFFNLTIVYLIWHTFFRGYIWVLIDYFCIWSLALCVCDFSGTPHLWYKNNAAHVNEKHIHCSWWYLISMMYQLIYHPFWEYSKLLSIASVETVLNVIIVLYASSLLMVAFTPSVSRALLEVSRHCRIRLS